MSRDRECLDNSFTFHLTFKCTSSNESSKKLKEATIITLASTVEELKQKIEDEYQIPSCVQTLYWQSIFLRPSSKLYDIGLRNGDTITVKYHSQCECKEVLASIQWLSSIVSEIKSKGVPTLTNRVSIHQFDLSSIETYLKNLSFIHFHPWLRPDKYVNKIFFHEHGGLQLISSLFELLLSVKWDSLELDAKFCLVLLQYVLWNFGESFMLRKQMYQHGVLTMCMKCLLIKPVTPFCDFLSEESNLEYLPVDCVSSAIGTLCNLSEVDEYKLEIAQNSEALLQMVHVSVCPTFSEFDSSEQSLHCVVLLFMALANLDEAHVHLAKDKYIDYLLQIFDIPSEREKKQLIILQYDILMFLVQLIIVSPQLLSSSTLQTISCQLASFLDTADPKLLAEVEIENEEIWQSFLPYIRLVYQPFDNESMSKELYWNCLELSVISLQNMLSRSDHREVLVKEEMLDFITCLPWYIDEASKAHSRAVDLVSMIRTSSDVHFKVPSLVNMSKAAVAKYYCGLVKAVKKSVPELLLELY